MSEPPRVPPLSQIEPGIPPEYQEFARWLTVDLHQDLTQRIISLGIPPDLATAVATDAVQTVVWKIERAAEFLAAAARASGGGKPPS